jgi:hypothetical protein
MLTANKILSSFDGWSDIGPSYEDESVTVYSGDLWHLAKRFSGESTDVKTLNRLYEIMERIGVELRFYDETVTDEQGRVHNTKPTCWHWTPTFIVGDGWIMAQDEVEDDLESYADLLVNNDDCADQWDVDFGKLGFRKVGDYESGFYPGQTDTPENARKALESKHGPLDIIWCIDSTGQFDMNFSAWIKPEGKE